MNAVEFIALLLILTFIAIPIYSLYQTTQQAKLNNTTTASSLQSEIGLASFLLTANPSPNPTSIKLSNGTTIVITSRNPFNYKIKFPINVTIPLTEFPQELPIYKAITFNTTRELVSALKPLKLNMANITFNNKTNEYIYSNSTVFFLYKKLDGKFTLSFRKPVKENPVIFVQRVGLLSWDFIVLKTNNEVSLVRLFQGIPSTIWIDIKTENGSIMEISGWLFKQIYLLAEYQVVQPQNISDYLIQRISGKIISKDWYISTLAFTKADIRSLSLKYTITLNDYIVPVYVFKGNYRLDIDNIHRSGELSGVILGITEKKS
ncbi:MAG: hypothetical protein F7B60_03205 [Desulfurococcales archaeon]|nr:hypothetical protein [Desulfurococcales archaeon]